MQCESKFVWLEMGATAFSRRYCLVKVYETTTLVKVIVETSSLCKIWETASLGPTGDWMHSRKFPLENDIHQGLVRNKSWLNLGNTTHASEWERSDVDMSHQRNESVILAIQSVHGRDHTLVQLDKCDCFDFVLLRKTESLFSCCGGKV